MSEEAIEPSDIDLTAETLSGDLLQVMLTHVRAMETPWSKLSERAQEDKIYALTNACSDIVRRAVRIIAAGDHEILDVQVPKFVVTEKLELKVLANVTTPNIELLAANRGRPAILMFVSAADYIGQREEVKADPDQPGLPMDDDGPVFDKTEHGSALAPDVDPAKAPEAA